MDSFESQLIHSAFCIGLSRGRKRNESRQVKQISQQASQPSCAVFYSFQNEMRPFSATLLDSCCIHPVRDLSQTHPRFQNGLLLLQALHKYFCPFCFLFNASRVDIMAQRFPSFHFLYSLIVSCMLTSENIELFVMSCIQKWDIARLCQVLTQMS